MNTTTMDARVGEEAAMMEHESGMGSSGGEMTNGTSSSGEDSSTFWSSSSNSDTSANDLSGMLHFV